MAYFRLVSHIEFYGLTICLAVLPSQCYASYASRAGCASRAGLQVVQVMQVMQVCKFRLHNVTAGKLCNRAGLCKSFKSCKSCKSCRSCKSCKSCRSCKLCKSCGFTACLLVSKSHLRLHSPKAAADPPASDKQGILLTLQVRGQYN